MLSRERGNSTFSSDTTEDLENSQVDSSGEELAVDPAMITEDEFKDRATGAEVAGAADIIELKGASKDVVDGSNDGSAGCGPSDGEINAA